MAERWRHVAHIGHAELLTPAPEASLDYFAALLGLTVAAEHGGSWYLRGYGDYESYCLKLTASDRAGLAHLAVRAWSPEALARRVAWLEAAGIGGRWTEPDGGKGPAHEFRDPAGRPAAGQEVQPPALRRPRRQRAAARARIPAGGRREGLPGVLGGRFRAADIRDHQARRRLRGRGLALVHRAGARDHLRAGLPGRRGASASPGVLGRFPGGRAARGRPDGRRRRADRGRAVPAHPDSGVSLFTREPKRALLPAD